MTFRSTNNNLIYLKDPTFTNVNRLFVLSFARNNAGDNRDFFSHYYLPVKNEEEAYEKIIDMSKNNDYTTGNLLDFDYSKKNCKLIANDLSKQTKLKDHQQINFIGKLENQNHGASMFFIIKKSEERIFKFSQNSVTII